MMKRIGIDLRGAALLLGLVACTGSIDGDAAEEPPRDSDPVAVAPGSTSPAPAAAKACTTSLAIAPTPIRRLTRAEYNHTVRDLLGVTSVRDAFGVATAPARAFPDDERLTGYESNSHAPITRLQYERYQEAAELVAAQVDVARLLPADCKTAGEEACARAVVQSFG